MSNGEPANERPNARFGPPPENGLIERNQRHAARWKIELSHEVHPAALKMKAKLAQRRSRREGSSRHALQIACEALHSTQEAYAFCVFESAFKEFGLPTAIRTDNGVPFASPNALFNLSKLSVWWLRLGIEIERIKPGHPQQNGRHERMHLTLKIETTRPAAQNFLQQQAKFDDFIGCYNTERPHQALAMRCPPSSTPRHRVPMPACRTCIIHSTTRRSPSPPAAASACTASSARASPAWPRPSRN